MANRDSLKNSGLFNMVGSRVLYALLYAKAVLRQLALSCHIIKAVCFLEFGLGLAYFLPVRIASSRQMIVRFSTQFRTTHPSANTGSSAKRDQGILQFLINTIYAKNQKFWFRPLFTHFHYINCLNSKLDFNKAYEYICMKILFW